MIESVKHLYERRQDVTLNGSREDPFRDGKYNLSNEDVCRIRLAGSVCTEQEVSVTMVEDE